MIELSSDPFDRLDPNPSVTLWQCLDPRTRLLCCVSLVFSISLTPNGRWDTWLIYGLAVLSLVAITRVSLPLLLRRLAVEMVFVGVVVIGTLFRDGGDVVWRWGALQVTTEGLIVLGSVSIKAILSLVMMNILTLTTSVPDLLQALHHLKMPAILVQILASLIRYLRVLVDEFQTMRQAASARNFGGSRSWQRLVIGNLIGSMFIRTFDRGERIHQAMLARGYGGEGFQTIAPHLQHRDRWALAGVGLLIGSGQIVPQLF